MKHTLNGESIVRSRIGQFERCAKVRATKTLLKKWRGFKPSTFSHKGRQNENLTVRNLDGRLNLTTV